MTPTLLLKPDPKLDLVGERMIDVPRDLVWTAWTKPEHVSKWFTPAPRTITDCKTDLPLPGASSEPSLRSPDGKGSSHVGCIWNSSQTSDWPGPTRCFPGTALQGVHSSQ